MASGKKGLSNWGGYFNPVYTLVMIHLGDFYDKFMGKYTIHGSLGLI